MTTNYRILGPDERFISGDQIRYLRNQDCRWYDIDSANVGRTVNGWNAAEHDTFWHVEVRRPAPYFPQWKQNWPEPHNRPVHVLWTETPPGTPTVAESATDATPEPLKPTPKVCTAYRMLQPDELVVYGDQFYMGGDWHPTNNHRTMNGQQSPGYQYRRRLTPRTGANPT